MDVSILAQIDDENVALIIQLLQEDSERMVSAALGKGKQLEGTQTDTQMAFDLFTEELQNVEAFFADRRMTRSIQNAIQLDGDALLRSQNEEKVAEYDHNLSVSLSHGEGEPMVLEDTLQPLTHDDELIEKMAYIYVNGIEDIESDDDTVAAGQPESSGWAASRQVNRSRQKRSCEACGERKHFAELSRAPCQHEYCRQCLSRLFRDAIIDESLFPPRCCKQPIPLDRSLLFLDANVVRQFRQKAVELSTPNRTYCHNANCAAFIPPANCSDTTAVCGECHRRTCTTCKGASHGGDCPNDVQLQRVLQLAREQGWQRCQNCWGMVELNTGCNHMTCRCGFQFCYICGAQWKTCRCDHWEERRLYERAAQIDARGQVGEEREAVPLGPHLGTPEEQQGEVEEQQEEDDQGERQSEPQDPDEDDQWQAESQELDEEEWRLEQQAPDPEEQLREFAEQQEHDRQERIRMIVQDLRVNHECSHERWASRSGPQECEECHDVMPVFIYECRRCHIIACRRCRYHRL
ncbi:hypothetical protein ANO14919_134120 [Xylariales sp. No.14919]|nr:hypothetical protein ANO14919_134120 [Xylariales sp. No.14919]